MLKPRATSVVTEVVAAACLREGPACDMAPTLKKLGNLKGVYGRHCDKMFGWRLTRMSVRQGT